MHGILYDLVLWPCERRALAARRERLLQHARGRVLEVGIGTGLNLAHYRSDIDLVGLDPDAFMLRRIPKRDRSGVKSLSIVQGTAEELPFSDNEFDTVVCTLVLCTVRDPLQALQEMFRVLKPGGQLLLLEHVRGRSEPLGKIFDLATPIWRRMAGGCHLNRDPGTLIQSVGFERQQEEELWHGLGKLWIVKKPVR